MSEHILVHINGNTTLAFLDLEDVRHFVGAFDAAWETFTSTEPRPDSVTIKTRHATVRIEWANIG